MTNPNPAFKKNILAGLSVPTSVLDPALRVFLQRVKEHVELSHGNSGQPKERFVTLSDLKDAGLISDIAVVRRRGEIAKTASATGAASASASSAGRDRLSELLDVTLIGSILYGQVLTYDADNNRWTNVTPAAATTAGDDVTALAYFLGD